MTRNVRILMAVAVVAFALASSAAVAQSFSGNWPATVTHSQYADGKYCLTLTDNGDFGWPHSGEASLVPQSGTDFGTFQFINGLLVVTFQQPGGLGQNAALVFTAHATKKGTIGKGAYEQVYGGEEFDSGVLVFGPKGGC